MRARSCFALEKECREVSPIKDLFMDVSTAANNQVVGWAIKMDVSEEKPDNRKKSKISV